MNGASRSLGEIARDQLMIGIFASAFVRLEGAIGDSANEKRLAAYRQELAIDRGPGDKSLRDRIGVNVG